MITELSQSVERLKGVGESVAAKLARLDIHTVGDLLRHFPRRYDDYSQVTPIRALKPGPVTLKGTIQQVATRRAHRRYMTITEAIITDGTGTAKAIWFNQPYIASQLQSGREVYLSGRLEFRANDLALQSPAVEAVTEETKNTARIVPVYPETEGLTSRQLRNLIKPLIDGLPDLPDPLPESVVTAAGLIDYTQALREVHFPTSAAQLTKARHRLAFEELFYLVLAGLVIKAEIKTEKAPQIKLQVDVARRLVSALEFQLTDAQRRAAWQILQDMEAEVPMNRLLEGDVGSGKTVVALLAITMAAAAGYQAALMVPTDILARQHFAKLQPLLAKLGYASGLLLGKDSAAVKRSTIAALKGGELQLVIGTHALLSEGVEFANLSLVVVDEQHRFGVAQRQTLKAKAGRLPHLLAMTATPIPRSLALTVYGDLDLSIIDKLPPGRKPIVTKVAGPDDRELVYQLIDTEIERGRQVFVVCPLIEDSDKTGAKSATAEAERLRHGVFAHRRIGLIHGRLKSDAKEAVMAEFVRGELDILVSTSVIEVGIDIPNATVMLIEGAERFGLAGLHQLRGRIGRGKHQSYCFLLYDPRADGASERLRALEKTSDGLRLAQIDLELRGPGQIYGLRQHGLLDLQIADITDTKLVAKVRENAQAFIKDPAEMLRYPDLVTRINQLKAVTSLD